MCTGPKNPPKSQASQTNARATRPCWLIQPNNHRVEQTPSPSCSFLPSRFFPPSPPTAPVSPEPRHQLPYPAAGEGEILPVPEDGLAPHGSEEGHLPREAPRDKGEAAATHRPLPRQVPLRLSILIRVFGLVPGWASESCRYVGSVVGTRGDGWVGCRTDRWCKP